MSCKMNYCVASCVMLLVLVCASPASAITDNSFEMFNPKQQQGTLTPGWSSVGGVQSKVQFRGQQATDGQRFTTLWTNRESRNDKQNIQGAERQALRNFLGGLDLNQQLGTKTFDGSAIRQRFTVEEDSTLTFDFSFGHRNGKGAGNDVAFVILDGVFYQLQRLASAVFTSSSSAKWQFTGWQTFSSLPLLTAGEHELVIGVVNVGDDRGRSALQLDGLTIAAAQVGGGGGPDDGDNGGNNGGDNGGNNGGSGEPDPQPVPEPMTAGLLMMGLAALTYTTHRRR